MNIFVAPGVQEKLTTKHDGITLRDIRECFANRTGKYLKDTRETHLTDPCTLWFIAETDYGKKLKICFIPYPDRLVIKTAYAPNKTELDIYDRKGSS
jgi:hypothetical protein